MRWQSWNRSWIDKSVRHKRAQSFQSVFFLAHRPGSKELCIDCILQNTKPIASLLKTHWNDFHSRRTGHLFRFLLAIHDLKLKRDAYASMKASLYENKMKIKWLIYKLSYHFEDVLSKFMFWCDQNLNNIPLVFI